MLQLNLNPYYELAYHPKKNRIYNKIKGVWTDSTNLESFKHDLRMAVLVTSPFTSMLFDLSDVKESNNLVSDYYLEISDMLDSLGVKLLAEVTANNSFVIHESPFRIKNRFITLQQADRWLDFHNDSVLHSKPKVREYAFAEV